MSGPTGTDADDPLVRALRREDPTDHPLGTEELLTGARRRAGRIRTRRRVALAASVLAVAVVPVGIGVLGDDLGGTIGPREDRTVLADPIPGERPQAQPVAVGDLLDDATVSAVLPGARRDSGADTVEEVGAQVSAGLCVDEAFSAATLLGGRGGSWTVDGTTPPQVVTQTVRRFEGEGAAAYVQVAREQVAACTDGTVTGLGTGAWTLVGDGSTGADVVTAYALVQQDAGGGGSLWRVRAVLQQDGMVVDVSADLVRETPDELSATAAGLAEAGLSELAGPQ